jgi:hypothetical protein
MIRKTTTLIIALWALTFLLFYTFRPNQYEDKAMTLNQLINDLDKSGKQYMAISNGDTALLSLTQKGTTVKGNLKFKFAKGNTTNGLLKGTIKGDTLYGDYLFKTEKGIWHRNPLAFLQSGGQLVMGVGQIYFAWGRGYFKKDEPIDYNLGRFVFAATDSPLALNLKLN